MSKKNVENRSIYIRSFEAVDLFNHVKYGRELYNKYVGMIPYSLELIKLESLTDFKVITNKHGKKLSNDIINLKFTVPAKVAELKKNSPEYIQLKNELDYQIKNRENCHVRVDKKEYTKKINEIKKQLKIMETLNVDQLREDIYNNGFVITSRNIKTDNATKTKYLIYKRSPAKSRTGECLAIKESLYNDMISWSRMHIDFNNDDNIDYPSLLATESLVSSSIEDTIKIPIENMLLIDDINSVFKWNVDLVKKDDKKNLVCEKVDKYEITNSLFDGQSLIDSSLMLNNYGFVLLRQHMFKSAGFSCNIQLFLHDYAKAHGIDFESWYIKDKYDNMVKASNIKFIFCPSSLKALKFSSYEHWKAIVQSEDCDFGVCKHEKQSKKGFNDNGNILNQTSYQMINSIQFSKDEIEKLSKLEANYIKSLQNNDNVYAEYLLENANTMNANIMMYDLFYRNSDIVKSQEFRDYRARQVYDYKVHCLKGKIRVPSDYCTMCGDGLSMLYHAVGALNPDQPPEGELCGNQIHTSLHDYGKEYVCIRNPHTSPSNVMIGNNIANTLYDKYFNATDNIVFVNSIKFPIEDILSGADFDSDCCIIFNDMTMLSAAKRMFKSHEYRVCINGINKNSIPYQLNKTDMAKIDNTLAKSQVNIGVAVDLGQLYMSLFWNELNSSDKFDQDYFDKVQQATVLGAIAIDSAKRMYDINIDQQIKILQKGLPDKLRKPLFFKYVGKSKNKSKKAKIHYETAMDYLQDIFNSIKRAGNKGKKTYTFKKFIDFDNANKRQEDRGQTKRILKYAEEFSNKIESLNAKYNDDDAGEEEKIEFINSCDDTLAEFEDKIKKLKITQDTMIQLVVKAIDSDYTIRLLNLLYNTHEDLFLNSFKKLNQNCKLIA